MRHSDSATQNSSSARYASHTRVDAHRSRLEAERVLDRYGGSDFAFVEDDANVSIQFAIQGRYVQLALPLPDPESTRFTHTPSGRRRTIAARERAYEQALGENWRTFAVVLRGKLASVESGIATFEDEFASFLLPPLVEETTTRKSSKGVRWLLRSSHSLAFALVAMFLVPASAVTAFALPPGVVENLSAPFTAAPSEALASRGVEALPAAPEGAKAGASDLGDTGSAATAIASAGPNAHGSGSDDGGGAGRGQAPAAGNGKGGAAGGGETGGGAAPGAGQGGQAAAGAQRSNGGGNGNGEPQGPGGDNGKHVGPGNDNGNHLGPGNDNGNAVGAGSGAKGGGETESGNPANGSPGNGSGKGKNASPPSAGP